MQRTLRACVLFLLLASNLLLPSPPALLAQEDVDEQTESDQPADPPVLEEFIVTNQVFLPIVVSSGENEISQEEEQEPGEATPPVSEPQQPEEDHSAASHQHLADDLLDVSMAELEASADPNAGVQTFVEAAANEHLIGRWSSIKPWPLVPIHAALLPNGKVLAWDSIGDLPTEEYEVHNTTRAAVFDPSSGSITRFDVNTGYNLFCAGFATLSDGKLFLAGGNKDKIFTGLTQTHLFNHESNGWSVGANMSVGRWYPSVTALANGEQLITAGGPDLAEVRAVNGAIRGLTSARLSLPLYPWLQTAPNGQAFLAGPAATMRYLNTSGAGAWTTVGTRDSSNRSYGAFAMYDVGKILVAGGASSLASALTINLNSGGAVAATQAMRFGRRQHNLTILADGTVLATGGNSSGAGLVDLNAGVFAAELWNPATGTWTTLANMAVTRQYHSVALLLPDGRVFSGGGGICGTCKQVGYLRKDHEIFTPPYLYRKDGSGVLATRPSMSGAPTAVGYGQSFSVSTAQAAAIQKVSFIRLGAVTHSTNFEQRYLPLNFTLGSGQLTMIAPANANLAPPGYYMLFIIDNNGVPSQAKIIRLDAGISTTGEYDVIARHSSKCIEVGGASQADGAQVQQRTCGGAAQTHQVWKLRQIGSSYQIVAKHSGKCLEVSGSSTADGALVQQRTCNSNNNQRWTLKLVGANSYQLSVRHSNKCLDVNGASTADGANAIQWTCHSGNNQLFGLARLN